MKSFGKGQGITALALVAALGAAVVLNWSFSKNAPKTVTQGEQKAAATAGQTSDTPKVVKTTAVFDPLAENGDAVPTQGESAENTETTTTTGDKNYGEAQLVSVTQDSGAQFFEEARQKRAKARDEALDSIRKALKSTALSDEEKSKLSQELGAEVSSLTVESDLETLIQAKGFADCVVLLDGDRVDVTVMTENDALTPAEVTKIRDVILNKCKGMQAQNITIVEVK